LHLQECFRGLRFKKGDFTHSEMAAKETLALPIYPEITEQMLTRVVDVLVEFYKLHL
jgi:dTDP-4-amino-4,6-dideoxygalactose transaminase